MDKRKSPRINVMKYTYRLVEQESDHADHVPEDCDFFVIEDGGRNDNTTWWGLEIFTRKLPYPRSGSNSYQRTKRWLQERYPEWML